MSAIEQRARELLVIQYREIGIEPQAESLMAQGHQPGGVHYAAVQAIIAALTPPEGFVLVSTELLEDLASEAESGIHQTVFVPAKRERRMAFVQEARALIAASSEAP